MARQAWRATGQRRIAVEWIWFGLAILAGFFLVGVGVQWIGEEHFGWEREDGGGG